MIIDVCRVHPINLLNELCPQNNLLLELSENASILPLRKSSVLLGNSISPLCETYFILPKEFNNS